MQFYTKAALQQLYDQVNRDNPNLPVVLSPQNAALTKGPVARGTNNRNTEVTFTGFPGTGVQGKVTLNYDRVNLTSLYGGFIPPVYFPKTVTTVGAALPYISEALGVTLTLDDITANVAAIAIVPNASLKSVAIQMGVNSLAYDGALTINYMADVVGTYPNSGPGTKTLRVGDTSAGYFGPVDASLLFTKKELLDTLWQTGTPPAAYGSNEGWHKFFYQGQVIYMPAAHVAGYPTWSDLYANGLVYGTDDNGKYPKTPAVNQSRLMLKKLPEGNFYLRPRLPKIDVNDPSTADANNASWHRTGSEAWLMSLLYNNGPWGNATDVDWTPTWLAQNSASVAPTSQTYQCSANLATFGRVQKTTWTSSGWRPVLELVDPSTVVVPLTDVTGKLPLVAQPVDFTAQQQLFISPLVPQSPDTTDFDPVVFGIEQPDRLSPTVPLLPDTVDFTPVVFITAIIPDPVKTSLSGTNGELGRFTKG